MKARILEIKRFAVHDGDGIRTTLFLKGCPLKCVWCHNPEGISASPQLSYIKEKCIGCGECAEVCPVGAHSMEGGIHSFEREKCIGCGKCEEACLGNALKLYGKEMSVDEVLPLLLEDKEIYKNSNGGVTLSGGECLCHAEFCAELLKRLKDEGVNTAVDTCGFVSRKAIDAVVPYTDTFLYDVKAADSEIHKKCTGRDNTVILENLKLLSESGARLEIRIPYVPDLNGGEMESIARHLSEMNIEKVKILPYHNFAASRYGALGMESTLPDTLPTREQTESVREIFRSFNPKAVIE